MFIEPMYANSVKRESLSDTSFKSGWGEYILDVKQDGVRCIVVHDHEGINLYSRTGKLQNGKVPGLEKELRDTLPYGSVIDGELALVDRLEEIGGQSVPVVNFNKTMTVIGSLPENAVLKQELMGKEVSLIAFDILKWEGTDFTSRDQMSRINKLYSEFKYTFDNEESLLYLGNVYSDPSQYLDLYDEITEKKIEGAILKNTKCLYVPGKRPAKHWYKAKRERSFDVVVLGYTEGQGKYEGQIGAIEFGAYDKDGSLVRIGKCSGLTDEERRDITNNKDEYLGRVFEVKSNDMVGSGEYRSPRHPNFLHWREDKLPEQCSRSQFHKENV